jgi:hypothetical protein
MMFLEGKSVGREKGSEMCILPLSNGMNKPNKVISMWGLPEQ